MSTKINFSQQTVAVIISLSFDDMKTMQIMLEGTAIEALDKEDHDALKNVKSIAEKFGIEIDLDFDTPIKVSPQGFAMPANYGGTALLKDDVPASIAKLEDGESSPDGLSEANETDDE